MVKEAKNINRYEIIGAEKEACKVINQMFDLEFDHLTTVISNNKLWVENLEMFNDEYPILKCFYLNTANDLIFVFEDYNEENERSYWLDMSVWNGSFDNPLKFIK